MNEKLKKMTEIYEQAKSKANETLGSMNAGAAVWYAKEFYNAGYRLEGETVEKIFDRLEQYVKHLRKYCEINEPLSYMFFAIETVKKEFENGELD